MEKKKKMGMESFTDYMERVIAMLEEEERYGTARVYYYALRSFTLFVGGGEIFFGALNRRALKRFESHLLAALCSWNTVSTYTRALRAVYNRAVDEEIIEGDYRLFSKVFTGVTSDKKRALPAEQMHRLLQPEAEENHAESEDLLQSMPEHIRRSQDLLTLMLLLQGIPFTDLVHLRKEDLKSNGNGEYLLSIRRRKTGTELNITVYPEAMELIERYKSNQPSSPYLLSFFDDLSNARERYKAYQLLLRKLNYGLSRLPRFCRMGDTKISSYTARHTWATLAKYCQIPEEIISEGLGHSSLKVTRTYLKSFEGDELAKANRMIMEYIFTGKKNTWTKA